MLNLITSSVDLGSGYYQNLRMRSSFVKLSGVVESVTKMVKGCLRKAKVAIFVV